MALPENIMASKPFRHDRKSLSPEVGARKKIIFDRCGFTMVELLVVAAILGILATMALSGFQLYQTNARITRAIVEVRNLEKEVNSYAVDKGTFPDSLAEISMGELIDPWGNKYVYKSPYVEGEMRYKGAKELNLDFDLYSKGVDSLTDLSINHDNSLDDIVRANEGGFVGPANKF
jgi:general secretion pathway protein G